MDDSKAYIWILGGLIGFMLLIKFAGHAMVWLSYSEPIVIPGAELVLDQGKLHTWSNCAGSKYSVYGPIVGAYLENKKQELDNAREQAKKDAETERIAMPFFGLAFLLLFCVAAKVAKSSQEEQEEQKIARPAGERHQLSEGQVPWPSSLKNSLGGYVKCLL